MDCFVASAFALRASTDELLLAMTTRREAAFSRRDLRPSFASSLSLMKKRAQGMPGA
jgi:hypothetical protein